MARMQALFSLEGRTAVVTGAGQGLGRGMALALAEAGADVAVVDRNAETAARTAAEFEGRGVRAAALVGDVGEEDDVARLMREAEGALGPVDILVNNAGISRHTPTAQMALADWEAVMRVNVTGAFLCCRAVAPGMLERGRGSIINVASMSALIVNRGVPQAPYYASKAGVVMLTKALAAEWAPAIRVNAIAPGYMRTPLNEGFLSDAARAREWADGVPLGRIGEPDDLAGAVVYLASEASAYVTGHTLVVDGGFTLW